MFFMTEKLVKDHFIRMIITPFAPFIPYSEPSFLISTSRMSSTDTALLASSNELYSVPPTMKSGSVLRAKDELPRIEAFICPSE